MLARFTKTPRTWHHKAAMRILRHLYITRHEYLITYSKPEKQQLTNTIIGFVDADWGRDYSRGGYIFMMNGGPIDWVSRLFRCTAHSSTEAEYMALGDAVAVIAVGIVYTSACMSSPRAETIE